MAITALYACLIRSIVQDIREGNAPASPRREVIEESRWLAQRYGTFAFLPTHGAEEAPGISEVAAELVSRLSPHAGALGCERELRGLIDIAGQGSSA